MQDAATLRADAGAVVRKMCKVANLYVIAHVLDDVGEATVRGALEAGGLVGAQADQIKPHRWVLPVLQAILKIHWTVVLAASRRPLQLAAG